LTLPVTYLVYHSSVFFIVPRVEAVPCVCCAVGGVLICSCGCIHGELCLEICVMLAGEPEEAVVMMWRCAPGSWSHTPVPASDLTLPWYFV